jgi:hypothetical protein
MPLYRKYMFLEKKKNTKTLEKSRVFKLFIGLSNTLISIY